MNGRLENELNIDDKIENKLASMPKYVSDWHLNLKASGKTAATRFEYISKIHQFLESISDNLIDVELSQINETTVTNFFIDCQKKETANGDVQKTSDSYQQMVWCVLNSFTEYLYKKKYISLNYTSLIDKPKNKDLARVNAHRILLTEDDFNAILKAVDSSTGDSGEEHRRGWRDKAILVLLMSTGMRRTALLNINISDVDFENKEISVIDKGEKRFVYKMNEMLEFTLNDWVRCRSQYGTGPKSDALFISNRGTRLSGRALSDMIKKYSKQGLGYSISPHKLRAGFCSIMYNKTNDIEFVRRAVGHSNVTTTQRYIVTDSSERQKSSNIMGEILSI